MYTKGDPACTERTMSVFPLVAEDIWAHLGHFLHHCDQISGLLSQTHGTSGGAQVSNWRVASAKCEGGGAQFSWCTGWAVNFAPLAGHSWAVVAKYPNG